MKNLTIEIANVKRLMDVARNDLRAAKVTLDAAAIHLTALEYDIQKEMENEDE
jgi:hypothetical protein